MKHNLLITISYFSVLIPFITCIVTYRQVRRNYSWFVKFILLIALSDLFHGFLFLKKAIPLRIVVANIATLCEISFATLIYNEWWLFKSHKTIPLFLCITYSILWLIEIIISGFSHYVNIFSIFSVAAGSILSIAMTIRLSTYGTELLHNSPKFIIAVGLLIFFFFSLIPNIFLFDFVKPSKHFQAYVQNIANSAVTISYLIFTYSLFLIAIKHNRNTIEFDYIQ